MKPFHALLVFVLIAGVAVADSKTKPTPATPDGAGFTVIFPSEFKETSKDIATTAGNMTVTTFRVELKSVVYSVSYADYPEALGKLDPEQILAGVRDGMKGNDGIMKRDDRRDLDGVIGREVVIEADRNQIRGRIFLSKRRLDQVLGSGKKSNIIDKDADAFFGTFAWAK